MYVCVCMRVADGGDSIQYVFISASIAISKLNVNDTRWTKNSRIQMDIIKLADVRYKINNDWN